MDHHLLHSALSGDDKLEKYELYLDTPKRNLRAIARLGDRACGHPRIVHGGAIASLLDDAFGCLFFAARVGNGFTAKLEVNYRRPLPAGTEVHILTHIDRVEGRKVRRRGGAGGRRGTARPGASAPARRRAGATARSDAALTCTPPTAAQVFLVGRVVDAERPDVLYTEAEALFVCKDVPSSAALVEGVQRTLHAPAGDAVVVVAASAAAATGAQQAPLA